MLIGNRLQDPVSFPKNDDEWHSFLDKDRHTYDPVEVALRINDYFESMPETSATIAQRTLSNQTGITRMRIMNEVMHLLGSWRIPDYYSKNTSWVNPTYEHRHRYADAAAVCECGAPVLRERFGDKYKQPLDVQEHNDDCCRLDRVQARGRMWEKRREIITEMTSLGHSFRQTNFRLGFAGDTDHGNDLAVKCGLDTDALQREGRAKVARTAIVLLRDYSTQDVADLYGLSRSALSRMLREETTASGRTLYSHRRRFKKTGSVIEASA